MADLGAVTAPSLTYPSPNHKARTALPRVLILHGSAGSDKGDLEWCAMSAADLVALWERTDPTKRPPKPWSPVSYHGIVLRTGAHETMVSLDRQAYHAGKSEWNGLRWLNNHSIGEAFSNRCDGKEALTDHQQDVMAGVVEGLARVVPSLEAVVTHSMVSPDRKFDPENCKGFEFAPYERAFARGVSARQAAAES